MSIATSLAALRQAKTDIAVAITDKGGTVNTGDGFADFAADIATISVGVSEGVSPKLDNPRGVTFYDYDGTVLESWTLTELQNATALPENPVHTGLTAQGWNWTLAELKSTAAPAQVGQHYITSDGKTRVRMMLYESTRIGMNLTLSGASLSVDWGDGGAAEAVSASTLLYHTYASAGEYVISIACQSGSWQFTPISWDVEPYYGSMARYSASNTIEGVPDFVREIWLGSGISALGDGCFHEFPRLRRISVPNTISSCGAYSFYGCRSLFAFVMPKAAGELSYDGFTQCRGLSVMCLPPSFAGPVRALAFCALRTLCVPNGATKVSGYGVQINHPLTCVVIPPSVTSIDAYAFKQCYGLYEVHMLSSTPPTLDSNAFNGLTVGDFTIYVPAGSLAAYQAATNWTVYADYMKEA